MDPTDANDLRRARSDGWSDDTLVYHGAGGDLTFAQAVEEAAQED
jgi:hypothetical protein